MTSVSYANGPKAGIFKLTEPEFSSEISKSSDIVGPVTPEVNTAILTTLKHLRLRQNIHHRCRRHAVLF